MLSKNSSSSRAIPFDKMVSNIENNMAKPVHWGKNQSGMKALDEEVDSYQSEMTWDNAARSAIEHSKNLSVKGIGLHKQIANRVTEAFQMMRVIMTTTSLDNVFNLRLHKDSQPEFVMLAYKICTAASNSKPLELGEGQWHLPYIVSHNVKEFNKNIYFDLDGNELSFDDALKISIASCAAVSYRTDVMTLDKADKIFDMLINAEVVHSSPFEHVATPIGNPCLNNGLQADYENALDRLQSEAGITHINKDLVFCSGNFIAWKQYRHLLDNNTCYDFNYEERMKEFN